MVLKLTQKERMLLNDQKFHEQLCIQKYLKYAKEAFDPALQQLFTNHAIAEQQHLSSINLILAGQVPLLNQQQGEDPTRVVATISSIGSKTNQNDLDLCNDMLATEKYVSGSYDTVIFECNDNNVRQALNHIQKEEQEHGKSLSNYLRVKGDYKLVLSM